MRWQTLFLASRCPESSRVPWQKRLLEAPRYLPARYFRARCLPARYFRARYLPANIWPATAGGHGRAAALGAVALRAQRQLRRVQRSPSATSASSRCLVIDCSHKDLRSRKSRGPRSIRPMSSLASAYGDWQARAAPAAASGVRCCSRLFLAGAYNC